MFSVPSSSRPPLPAWCCPLQLSLLVGAVTQLTSLDGLNQGLLVRHLRLRVHTERNAMSDELLISIYLNCASCGRPVRVGEHPADPDRDGALGWKQMDRHRNATARARIAHGGARMTG